MENLVSTVAPPFLIGSSSFLQVMSPTIKFLSGWKLARSNLGVWSYLAALEHLKKISIDI